MPQDPALEGKNELENILIWVQQNDKKTFLVKFLWHANFELSKVFLWH